ncbi:MAG: SDR family oxidoreductase [Flavobacteriales bacterium]|nr:SDR family oxidoreductase [Flavobacteriales bacterium]
MRKIVLTGASGGLGLVIAENLLSEGYFVHLIGNKNTSKLELLHSKFPSNSKVYSIDFSQAIDFSELVNEIGQIDALVHALGVSSAGMSWKITPEEWQRVMHLNLTVPFLLTQAFTPQLRATKFGRIIFFSSVVAQKGFIGTAAYAASKSALIGLTRTLSVELINSGITVNCIAPGYMDKGMIEEVTDEYLKDILKLIPSNSLGDSVNIAHTVSYLLSEKASYITGQVINVNGGMN